MHGFDVGLVGVGVMGRNLALNVARHGYSLVACDRSADKVQGLIEQATDPATRSRIVGADSLPDLARALAVPRTIIMLVEAGPAVDSVIAALLPYLDRGDVIVDAGNSHFRDTARRAGTLERQGILFLGVGLSGGHRGALDGPCIMAGGSPGAWERVRVLLQAVAARAEDGAPCCAFFGHDGAGHYVKMLHNGIEYADMQLVCEAYALMRTGLGMSAAECGEVFATWNRSDLESYLMGITADILARTDAESGQAMVDVIDDRAGQKGTGRWLVQDALDRGVAVPTVAAAVHSRDLSALGEERLAASGLVRGPDAAALPREAERHGALADMRESLLASRICTYAQGFALVKTASVAEGWAVDPGQVASIWRAGCIIRARLLESVCEAFRRNPDLANLLVDSEIARRLARDELQEGWRRTVCRAAAWGLAAPAMSSALAYYDSYRARRLPTSLLQAQRDYFGAHGYQRTDRPGRFRADWSSPARQPLRGDPVD